MAQSNATEYSRFNLSLEADESKELCVIRLSNGKFFAIESSFSDKHPGFILSPYNGKSVIIHSRECSIDLRPDVLQDTLGYEHADFPRSDWSYQVQNDYTVLGYWEWLSHQMESALN